jgi:hypothetical protein
VDEREIGRWLRAQDGLVSRRQVLDLGGTDNDIERLLRRREWARVHPGVYADHTGSLTWPQCAWAAVLLLAPAALSGSSALRAHGVRGHDARSRVEVAVAAQRHVRQPTGVRLVRLRRFEAVAQLHLSPPRVRVEPALLRVASRAGSLDAAVAVLADGCQSGRTTPVRLIAELATIDRIPRRQLIEDVLADLAEGAFSALERRYLRDVERAHALPRAARQRVAGGAVRDVEYGRWRTRVELDGRLGHEWSSDRWDDLDRDIDSAVEDHLTVRIGWRQVLQPCRLAERMTRILVARGWPGRPRRCGPTCQLS